MGCSSGRVSIGLVSSVLLIAVGALAFGLRLHFTEDVVLEVPRQNYEVHAVQLLSGLYEAEEYVRRNAFLDSDNDSQGEYMTMDLLLQHQAIERKAWERLTDEVYRFGGENGFCVKVVLPEATDNAELNWCAFAWPSNWSRYKMVFCTFKGAVGRVYESDSLGRQPTISDLFDGAPFTGVIRSSVWRPNSVLFPDHPSVKGR